MYKTHYVSTHGPGVPDLEELDSYGYVALCVYLSQCHTAKGLHALECYNKTIIYEQKWWKH